MTEARFALDFSSVRSARIFACAAVGDTSPEVVDVVAAIVGELASNSIRHAASGFVVRIERDEAGIRIEVADVGEGLPEPQSPALADPAGRGLQIVGALADEWGVREHIGEPGKAVWATVSLDGSGASRATTGLRRPTVGGT